ncbi:DUF3159 domain-containing protein [Corynebacterium heidelbergense]|uniref:DUF3159 domain-containing protein n=2 Tax=Corynebacterium heidelbergense TaxID=2055947 RepID=A0A364VAT7_9CORY|nr:DUF3159 domain-containing protein [Corynebacterium heidelbergense]
MPSHPEPNGSPDTPSTPPPGVGTGSAPGASPAKSHASDSDTPASSATMLEQMGGLGGLVASTLPILVMVPVNNAYGLKPALGAALGVATAVLVWRLVRKENVQPAVSGFIGVAIGAAIAWILGDAKGFFAYGIWYSLVAGIVFSLSIPLRWPLVGVIWRSINGHDQRWRTNRRAVRAFSLATACWAVVFFARFGVQQWLYLRDATTALGYTRIAMGWPLTIAALLITVWAVRRANAAEGRH